MAFLFFVTTWAMISNLIRYWTQSQSMLLGVGGFIFVLELWLIMEAVVAIRAALADRAAEGQEDSDSTAAA